MTGLEILQGAKAVFGAVAGAADWLTKRGQGQREERVANLARKILTYTRQRQAQLTAVGGGRLLITEAGIIATAGLVEPDEVQHVSEAFELLVAMGHLTPQRDAYCLTSYMVTGRIGPG